MSDRVEMPDAFVNAILYLLMFNQQSIRETVHRSNNITKLTHEIVIRESWIIMTWNHVTSKSTDKNIRKNALSTSVYVDASQIQIITRKYQELARHEIDKS